MKKRNAKKNIVYGKAVRPNAGIRAWYRDVLVKMVKEMNETVLKRVLRVYKKYQNQIVPKGAMDANISSQEDAELRKLQQEIIKQYQDMARGLAERFVARTNKYSQSTVNESVKGLLNEAASAGFSVTGQAVSKELAATLKAAIYENVLYIKSLPEEYLRDVAGAVWRNIAKGESADVIEKAIRVSGKVCQRRAELIARDQSQKAFEALSRMHMKGAGVDHFEWIATGGGLYPRPLHHRHFDQGGLNHGIFSFDNPPMIQEPYVPKTDRGTAKPAVYGFPGDLPYCQCIKRPVLVLGNKTI